MRWLKARLRSLLSGSSDGFTLAEVLVTVGLLSITMSLMGGSIFQALGIVRFWQDDAIATKELRHAIMWFSRDAPNAQATDLVDGAPPVSSVSMSWTDKDGVPHTAIYSLVANRLVRNYDGNEITVARIVDSVSFSRSGSILTLNLTVTASRDGTESKGLDAYARRLQ